ncbi:carboxymuconolactone decarboxylase family protein [Rhodococcoides fascians]|uniref:carboxymuconolactone decarboxylase family protein n=1 Tax=Rhodococcoides fascians TaxID=1828 RepID=UPI00050CF072|nr:carboxymuconolactone decarboxylase family protein [Rhodococcus fascians]
MHKGESPTTRDAGRRIIAELMGADYLARKDARENWFSSSLNELAEEVCFGRTWSREGIDRKQRCIVTIAVMVALNRPTQLGLHIEGALNNGVAPRELREILLHTAVYCGLPAAGSAFAVTEEALTAAQIEFDRD